MAAILYLAPMVTEELATERGLPAVNAAGSNRMRRISTALHAAGARVVLLAPGSSLRCRWTGTLLHKPKLRRFQAGITVFPGAIGIRYLSGVGELVSMLIATFNLCSRRKFDYILVYNYYPSSVLSACLAKLMVGAPLIAQVEDVCMPRIVDWMGKGDSRPLFQMVGHMLMRFLVSESHGLIVPSRRFLNVFGSREYRRISGCISVDEITPKKESPLPLKVLVAGLLDAEQGIYRVLDALAIAGHRGSLADKLAVNICGFATDEARLKTQIERARKLGVLIQYHGCVGDDNYHALLADADICIAAQLPEGRHAGLKTPSKVYEYLAHGKTVIATRVGDLSELPDDIIILCNGTAAEICGHLERCVADWHHGVLFGRRAHEYAQRVFNSRCVGDTILALCREIGRVQYVI